MQLEKVLEDELINKLKKLGYEYINIKNNNDLKLNLKNQIEKFNKIKLTEQDFSQIYNHLNRGDIFQRSRILREENNFQLNNGKIISFFNKKFCENYFQVSNQIRINNEKNQRYDVTLFINGFPLVQIELKKRGIDLHEAFKQCHRYKMNFKEMFNFIQVFIISNGSQTRYFATNTENEDHLSNNFMFSFIWTDEFNKPINSLLSSENDKESFANSFLSPCKLAEMIFKYMVIQKGTREIKILRPYQFYAVKAILDKVKSNNRGGYIWHTTGSGKTLTAFKSVQIIRDEIEDIKKILFVVDRRDLDSQSKKQFDNFSLIEGDIKSTKTINELKNELFNDKREIIITTIQKLNALLKKEKENIKNNSLRDKKIVIVFDEAHRSQSGESISNIKNYFNKLKIFGFTGTPIFEINKINNRTTEENFGKELHHYTIQNAINDKNVLPFSIEYFRTFKLKDEKKIELDEKGDELTDNELDKQEIWNNEIRIKAIAKKIFEIHNKKTYEKIFNGLLVVSSVEMLIDYYKNFEELNKNLTNDKKLKISAIFSLDHEDQSNSRINKEVFLKKIIKDFNKISSNKVDIYDKNWFESYRTKLIKNLIDNSNLDIVIVVNMLTTGFDSKLLNTIYIDKNLKYHTLIQTFSRTNRVYNSIKDNGQILSFRPIKRNVKEAIKLFADENANTIVLKESYLIYLKRFNELINSFLDKYKNVDNVESFRDNSNKVSYVNDFKEILSQFNMLKSFTSFNDKDLKIDRQKFEEFKNVYNNLYKEQKEDKEQISGLHELDFSIEFLDYEKIDAFYIEKCLKEINNIPFNKNIYINELKKLQSNIKKSLYPQRLIDLIIEFINETINDIEINNSIKKISMENLIDNLNLKQQNMIEKLIINEELNRIHIENVIKQYHINESIDKNELKKSISIKGREGIFKRKKIQEEIINIFTLTSFNNDFKNKII